MDLLGLALQLRFEARRAKQQQAGRGQQQRQEQHDGTAGPGGGVRKELPWHGFQEKRRPAPPPIAAQTSAINAVLERFGNRLVGRSSLLVEPESHDGSRCPDSDGIAVDEQARDDRLAIDFKALAGLPGQQVVCPLLGERGVVHRYRGLMVGGKTDGRVARRADTQRRFREGLPLPLVRSTEVIQHRGLGHSAMVRRRRSHV